MYLILKLIGSNDILDLSKIYIENTSVIVKSGPLQGMEGIIRKIDRRKNKAKIVLKFLDSEKIIDIGIEYPEKS